MAIYEKGFEKPSPIQGNSFFFDSDFNFFILYFL